MVRRVTLSPSNDTYFLPPQSSAAKDRSHVPARKSPSPAPEDLSPSCPVKGMYRLLDLITEQGSSGLGNHLS
jgi:hypothetical protein